MTDSTNKENGQERPPTLTPSQFGDGDRSAREMSYLPVTVTGPTTVLETVPVNTTGTAEGLISADLGTVAEKAGVGTEARGRIKRVGNGIGPIAMSN